METIEERLTNLSALIPILGFILSIQSLSIIKKHWVKKR